LVEVGKERPIYNETIKCKPVKPEIKPLPKLVRFVKCDVDNKLQDEQPFFLTETTDQPVKHKLEFDNFKLNH
jgi:hypothetical protein